MPKSESRFTSASLAGPLILMISVDFSLTALVGASSAPLGLYEPDIYTSIPLWAWSSVFLAFAIPLVTYFLLMIRTRFPMPIAKWLVAAYVSANFALLLMPWARYPAGYDRWDSWYHLAEATYVARTGHTTATNIYPATHLLLVTFAGATGASLKNVFSIFPTLISSLLLLSAYAAAAWARIDPRQRFLVVLAISALQIAPAVFPIAFSFVYLVWIVGFFLSFAPGVGRHILLLMLFAALVITHLLTAVSVVIGLVAVAVLFGQKSRSRNRFSLVATVLMFSWVFWFTQAYVSPTLLVADIVATGTFRARNYTQILAGVGLTGIDALLVVTKITLARVAALLLSIPGAMLGTRRLLRRAVSPESLLVSWSAANLIVFIVLGSLFGAGTIGDIIDRFVSYGLFPLGFLAAFGFLRKAADQETSTFKRSGFLALLLGLVLVVGQVGFFYPAPGTARYNWEAGTTDLYGLTWVGGNLPPSKVVGASNDNSAMLAALIGRDRATGLGFSFDLMLPNHLGCGQSPGGTPDFLIVTSFDIFVFGRRGEIRPNDLECLDNSS